MFRSLVSDGSDTFVFNMRVRCRKFLLLAKSTAGHVRAAIEKCSHEHQCTLDRYYLRISMQFFKHFLSIQNASDTVTVLYLPLQVQNIQF